MGSDPIQERIRAHLDESARVKRALIGGAPAIGVAQTTSIDGAIVSAVPAIAAAARLIADTFQKGGKLLLCGNGGSAADCQHMAAEFVSKLRKTDALRRPLPAVSLTTNTSFLTAFANDVAFEEIFSRQVEALGQPGDVLIGISTSGASPNVLRAVETAHARGLRTIGLGGSGGRLGSMVDVVVAVPSNAVAHIQEAHLAIEHAICDAVEEIIFYGGAEAVGAPAEDALA